MYSKEIDRLLEGWKGEYIEMLRRWISVDSVARESAGEGMPFGAENRRMLDMALADARAMGFETAQFDGYAGHAAYGQGDETMGMLVHLDVVPAGEGWTFSPFGGELVGAKLYGRGATDNKGPAVAALFAMRAVKEAGIPLKHGVRLIFGCDEEVGMSDMRHYAKATDMPNYGFSPDAGFPLINIEKGGLNIRLSGGGSERGANIPIHEIHAGERPNVVPSEGYAIVGADHVSADQMRELLAPLSLDLTVTEIEGGRARLDARGVSAHGAAPGGGVNAAGILLKALAHLGAGGETAAAQIAALAEKLGMESDGKALGIDIEEELSGALTCNLGILRYDGHHLSAVLDIRYPIGAQEPFILGQICVAFSAAKLSVCRLSGRPVHHIPKEHRVVRELLKVYQDITGLEPYTISMGGGTYARMMPNCVAFGAGFPNGRSGPCHAPDEYVDVDEIMEAARVMAHAIEALAGESAG